MLLKLAVGNVRRSARDFSVYALTLAFAACLLYSFLSSTDYLLALDLTEAQRLYFHKAREILGAFSVFIDVIFVFLLGYANVFLVRRRTREFGLYTLLGMGPGHVSMVLALESGLMGVLALVAGIALGAALSPVFGLVAAFVFGVSWHPVATFSPEATVQCVCSFAVITVVAALLAVRSIRRRTLLELMQTERTPERPRLAGRGQLRAQTVAAALLLALVWGTCLLNPGYFIVFIVPMGFIALGGTYLLFRVLARRLPERLRTRRPERYYAGLTPFTVRQVEARVESGCAALAAECVLIAAGLCMVVAGLVFSVGLRASASEFAMSADGMAPIAYACVFYGAAFLVAAAAVLALQQLSQAADAHAAYRALHRLGAPRRLAAGSLRRQVGVSFAAPFAMACAHCVFGFVLIGALALMAESAGFVPIVAGTVGATAAVFALYYLLTCRVCERGLVR